MGRVNPDGAIFLSAGVPDPSAAHFVAEADPSAISAAVSALLFVVLGRRKLVWGGHPSITPMVWAFAESMDVNYGKWVKLYQSLYFEDLFPEETRRFENVVLTQRVSDNVEPNLEVMRTRMLSENEFGAAVFLGGMKGIFDEHQLFESRAPGAVLLPVASTGGATAVLAEQVNAPQPLFKSLDYVQLFYSMLEVDPAEARFATPEEQPREREKRLDPKRRPDSQPQLKPQ